MVGRVGRRCCIGGDSSTPQLSSRLSFFLPSHASPHKQKGMACIVSPFRLFSPSPAGPDISKAKHIPSLAWPTRPEDPANHALSLLIRTDPVFAAQGQRKQTVVPALGVPCWESMTLASCTCNLDSPCNYHQQRAILSTVRRIQAVVLHALMHSATFPVSGVICRLTTGRSSYSNQA